MTALRPLAEIVELLDRARVPHMLVGSFASTYYSAPRSTQDIDLVVDPTEPALESFLASVHPDDWYVPEVSARDAFRNRTQFNAIHSDTGWKVDLIIMKDRPFSRSEFARRERAVVSGVPVYVASREDVVLAKLEWASHGESSRQLDDARAVLRAVAVDGGYLDRWAPELGVVDLLAEARPR